MKSKIFSLMIFGIFAMVAMFGMASATTSNVFNISNLNSPSSISESSGSFTFTFEVNYHGASTDADISFSDSTISGGSISIPTITNLDGTVSGGDTRTVTGTINGFSNLAGQNLNARVNATVVGTSARDDETTFSVSITPTTEVTETQACTFDNTETSYSSYSKLDVSVKGFDTINGFGDDEEMVVFDELEVEVEVENTDNEDIDDISLEWAIVKSDVGTALDDDDFLKEFDEIDEFDLKDGDDGTFTFTFKVDDNDLDMDIEDFLGGDYTLIVRATGEVDDDNNTPTCGAEVYDNELTISDNTILILSDFAVDGINLDEDNFYPDTLTCGTELQVTADLWSIGDDQGDISVRVYNKDLGIDSFVEIGDIDESENEPLSFSLQIPEGIENKIYSIEFAVYEDNEIFENEYLDDDEDAVFNVLLEVTDCVSGKATVSASLESGGKAGKDLVVKTSITNTGSKQTTYTLNAAGYSTWASSALVEPQTLTLAAGESAEALVTLNTLKSASGNNIFNLEVLSEGELVMSQQIQVPLEKSLVGGLFDGENTGVTIMVMAIAALLLVILIVVLVKVLRK